MNKKGIIILVCILLAAVLAVGGFLFLKHEKRQSTYAQNLNNKVNLIDQEQTFYEGEQEKAITGLKTKISESETKQKEAIAGLETKVNESEKELFSLTERLNRIEEMQQIMKSDDSYDYKFNCLYGNSYNVLVIGNSITIHPIKEYWWAERGMAASSDEKDYVHILKSRLEQIHENVNIKAVQFRSWEIQAYERKDEYALVDRYLNDKIDWIIVQVGENVSDLTTYESDYIELLLHLHSAVPTAKILTIGDFWKDETKDSINKRVAEGLNIAYVDLSEIQDDPDYQAGLGTVVLGEDGKTHQIAHEGVAAHPNDKAMEYIADKVMEVIRQFSN